MGILARLDAEKRSHPANPDAWLINGFVGRESASGVRVDEDTALSSTAVWAAVWLLASTLATVPLHVLRQDGRSKTVDREHPTDELLYRRPNSELTATELREMLVANTILGGNGYAEIVWRNGYPRELWPLWSNRVKVERLGGTIAYRVYLTDGQQVILPRQNVLHLRGRSLGGLVGMSPIDEHRDSIGLTMALEEYGARFFRNGATPSGVVSHPARLSKEAQDRLRASMEGSNAGLTNAHRLMILEEGMQWAQRGISPEQAQAIESRKFQIEEVARIFGVPPHLIQHLERSTFNNIEHQGIEFVRYSIRDWAVRIEQRMELSLLTEGDLGGGYIIKHNLEGLLRGDIKTRYEAYAQGRQNGWLSANDVRELEDLNPIEGEGGDEYHIQLNMVPLDMAGEPPPEPEPDPQAPAPEDPQPEEESARAEARKEQRQKNAAIWRHRQQGAYRQVLEDVAARVVAREVKVVRRGFLSAWKKRNANDVKAWLDATYAEEPRFVAEAFLAAFRAFAELVATATSIETGADRDISADLDAFVSEYASTFGARWAAISRGVLEKILKDTPADDLERVLDETLNDWEAKRAGKVARDEATRANSAFATYAYKLFGIATLRWVTMGDTCPFCSQLDGRTVAITGHFLEAGTVVNGGAGEAPMTTKQVLRHPPLHSGCDCQVVAG